MTTAAELDRLMFGTAATPSLDELMFGAPQPEQPAPPRKPKRAVRRMSILPAYMPLLHTHDMDPFSETFGLPYRYKIMHGGRGGGKSWAVAMALVALAYSAKYVILCTREFQTSIKDSVHKVIKDVIYRYGLWPYFIIQKDAIYCPRTGSEFIFKGMHNNEQGIKSTEGVDICWIEEAQTVTHESLQALIPTVRKEWRGADGRLHMSQIWLTFNLLDEDSPVHREFLAHPPAEPGLFAAWVRKINYDENPHFPAVLDAERRKMERLDPEAYMHVWLGFPRRFGAAAVFRNRFEVCDFDSPDPQDADTRFYFGADFGFANDPSTLIRSFIKDNVLHIDQEAYRKHVELDDMHAFYAEVPESHRWPIKADNARPETISYMARTQVINGVTWPGYNISAAEKWPGCVEDRITHIKGFERIRIHTRCVNTADEFRRYSFKVDRLTKDVLSIPVDAHNHTIDAIGYSLDGMIQRRGAGSSWAAFAE